MLPGESKKCPPGLVACYTRLRHFMHFRLSYIEMFRQYKLTLLFVIINTNSKYLSTVCGRCLCRQTEVTRINTSDSQQSAHCVILLWVLSRLFEYKPPDSSRSPHIEYIVHIISLGKIRSTFCPVGNSGLWQNSKVNL